MAENKANEIKSNMRIRPPVVVVMGHVDHGKTSILDYIRKTKAVEKESGGITQNIGAYQVSHGDKKITFIDTPGHEAFFAMRAHGAKVADIAILVVAADDGVMPQTKEAIRHIKLAGIPMIIAINKIDRQNADAMKVKNQLLEDNIVVEDYKGDTPSVNVSAKTGEGMDNLLEMINLVAEISEIKSEEGALPEGIVIESELDHKRGPVATLIVRQGILKKGDIVSLSTTWGTVKILEDFQGTLMAEAEPGTPVFVVGLSEVPQVGEKFKVVNSQKEAEERVAKDANKEKVAEVIEVKEGAKIFNLVLKSDVRGTLEALRNVILGVEDENVTFRFLSEGVGEITERDIKLASTAKALIVGFRTKVTQSSENFAKQMKVGIITGDVIYELVESVRAAVSDLISGEKEEVDLGSLKVAAIFRTEKSKMIIGGRVSGDELKKGARVRVIRGEEIIGEGKISQLKIIDKAVDKVEAGKECGVLFEGPVKILAGDILQADEIREKIIRL